jgi:hypothetical protein
VVNDRSQFMPTLQRRRRLRDDQGNRRTNRCYHPSRTTINCLTDFHLRYARAASSKTHERTFKFLSTITSHIPPFLFDWHHLPVFLYTGRISFMRTGALRRLRTLFFLSIWQERRGMDLNNFFWTAHEMTFSTNLLTVYAGSLG